MQTVFALFFHHYIIQGVAIGAALSFAIFPVGFASLDFINALRLMFKRPTPKIETKPYHDFAILVPIFNNMKYLRNTWFLKQYSDQVIICTTTHESPEFYHDLDEICAEYGFRQYRADVPVIKSAGSKSHNPWKIFTHAVKQILVSESDEAEERTDILLEGSEIMAYEYCILLDGDTVCDGKLEDVMGEFVARDLDLASVRVVPSKTTTLVQRLQAIEYRIAMDTRKNYPWLTSGACMFAKTRTLHTAFQNHSHFFQGGDIEIGKLSRILGYNVGHLDTQFLTDVPATWKAWFKQRVAWSSGDFRHSVVNMHAYSWRHPLFFGYGTLVVYGLLPFRLWFAFTEPLIFPTVLCAYWLLLFVFAWQYRCRYLPMLPFYGMFQALIIIPLGIYHYFRTAYKHRNPGIIKLRDERQGWLQTALSWDVE